MTIKQERFINQQGFDPQQMKQARLAFVDGLTIEQVAFSTNQSLIICR